METLEEEEDITTTDLAVAAVAAKDLSVVIADHLAVNRITLIIIASNHLDNNNLNNLMDSVVDKCKDLNNKCINEGLINHNNLCLINKCKMVADVQEVQDFLKTHNMDKCLDYLQASNDDHNKYMFFKDF